MYKLFVFILVVLILLLPNIGCNRKSADPTGSIRLDIPDKNMIYNFPGGTKPFLLSLDGKTLYTYEDGKTVVKELPPTERYMYKYNFSMHIRLKGSDSLAVVHLIDSVFTPDTLLKYFSPGPQNFYMTLMKINNGSTLLRFNPCVDGVSQLASNFQMRNRDFEPFMNFGPAFTETGAFYKIYRDPRNPANSTQGEGGEQVFEVKAGVDRNGKRIMPTRVMTIDENKYIADIDALYIDKNVFPTYAMTGIIGGYEALSSKITYPPQATKEGISGRVLVKVFLNEDGSVGGTQLLKGIGSGCDEAARRALRQVKFYPQPDGKKNQWVVPIDFELSPQPMHFDLACRTFDFLPDNSFRNNNITYTVQNVGEETVPTNKFSIMVYIDGQMVAASGLNGRFKPNAIGTYYLHWKPTPGEHEYVMYIDPDNTLKEANRSNNVLRGRFTGPQVKNK